MRAPSWLGRRNGKRLRILANKFQTLAFEVLASVFRCVPRGRVGQRCELDASSMAVVYQAHQAYPRFIV